MDSSSSSAGLVLDAFGESVVSESYNNSQFVLKFILNVNN